MVATHGGCGTTTVARLLDAPETTLDQVDPDTVVVLVAAATPHGTRHLMDAVSSLTEPDGYRDGLVVVAVADGRGPTPPAARARLARIRSRVRVWQLPHVHAWRWNDPARTPDGSRSWQRMTTRLVRHVERTARIRAHDLPVDQPQEDN